MLVTFNPSELRVIRAMTQLAKDTGVLQWMGAKDIMLLVFPSREATIKELRSVRNAICRRLVREGLIVPYDQSGKSGYYRLTTQGFVFGESASIQRESVVGYGEMEKKTGVTPVERLIEEHPERFNLKIGDPPKSSKTKRGRPKGSGLVRVVEEGYTPEYEAPMIKIKPEPESDQPVAVRHRKPKRLFPQKPRAVGRKKKNSIEIVSQGSVQIIEEEFFPTEGRGVRELKMEDLRKRLVNKLSTPKVYGKEKEMREAFNKRVLDNAKASAGVRPDKKGRPPLKSRVKGPNS